LLPADAERVLASAHHSTTGDTITDTEELRRRFDSVARTALATENDEAVLGESSVAAPIFGPPSQAIGAIGAIGVVLPTTDWPVSEPVRDALREAARNISRELGAPRWPAKVQQAAATP
jgi:DNA-binding IclR family transcriptional regulator